MTAYTDEITMKTKIWITALNVISAFFIICGAGLFIAAAGGQEWGTFDAGMMALVTIMVAAFVAVLVAVGMWKWLSDL